MLIDYSGSDQFFPVVPRSKLSRRNTLLRFVKNKIKAFFPLMQNTTFQFLAIPDPHGIRPRLTLVEFQIFAYPMNIRRWNEQALPEQTRMVITHSGINDIFIRV